MNMLQAMPATSAAEIIWQPWKRCTSNSNNKETWSLVTSMRSSINQPQSSVLTSLPKSWANKFPYHPSQRELNFMQFWTNDTVNHRYCFYKRPGGWGENRNQRKERRKKKRNSGTELKESHQTRSLRSSQGWPPAARSQAKTLFPA